MTLLETQRRALLSLLNLNDPPPAVVWKVLILDGASRDVLATSLRVQDLREQGVTLHLQLDSPRPPLTDVPAVYFVSPSPHNIRRIAADLNPPLYSAYHLAFTSALPRPLLEELASLILANDPSANSAQLILSVTDQFLDFIVPSQNMFSLLPRKEVSGEEEWVDGRPSYVVLNDPRATEVDIEREVGRIANGLFSVVTAMSMVPIIRCPRGNAAEMVARRLDAKLRDHIASTSSRNARDAYSVDALQRPCKSIHL